MTYIATTPSRKPDSLAFPATTLIITCEHGGNRIPAPYRHIFRGCRPLLDSHRGYDSGALAFARSLSSYFSAPLLASTTSRLLVDLNRSIGHRNLHAEIIKALPDSIRKEIVDRYYHPYRAEAERLVSLQASLHGRVIHISCHSFTDNLDGIVRHADIGLLYDPNQLEERALCSRWKSALNASFHDIKVRRNYPYKGSNDGLTSALRKKFPSGVYTGIEIELNQKCILPEADNRTTLRKSAITSLDKALRELYP